MEKKLITIILADDHKILREGLKGLIEKQPDMKIIGEAETGHAIIKMSEELNPDVIVMDIGMPDLNGIEATREIKKIRPDIKIIGLSIYSEQEYVKEMLRAGASGYLLKDCAFQELNQAINTIMHNKIYLSPSISDNIIMEYKTLINIKTTNINDTLSKRERQVLQLLAEGNNTREIATKLFVSTKTIETHRRQIMIKLNLYSIAELTKYAIRHGITHLEY